MLATNTTSCIEMSMRCGEPDASAVSTANAVSAPTCAYPDGSLHRTGGRSGSPVAYMFPLDAIPPGSDARQPACGPVAPNGVTRAQTAREARAGSRSNVPGKPGVSITASAVSSSSSRRGSSGPSTTTLALPAPQARKRRGGGRRGGAPPPPAQGTPGAGGGGEGPPPPAGAPGGGVEPGPPPEGFGHRPPPPTG